jgi:spheroidene monooxygenase
MQTVTLSLFRFGKVSDIVWMLGQMLAARGPLRALPELETFKLMGTGTREGFHPVPNFTVWGVLCTWPSPEVARSRIAETPVFQRFRDHAIENVTIYLSATRARGQWAGVRPFEVGEAPLNAANEKVAVLTRATIKPRHALSFWKQVPNISAQIPDQEALRFKIGLGEVPWLHQITFTIWDDKASMDAFAYQSWHGEAVRAVREGGWFSEELFARFRVLGVEGRWEGRPPLGEDLKVAA